MAVSTADRYDTTAQIVRNLTIPVAANTVIYKNTAVCVNSAGDAVPAANTAGLVYAGQAMVQANNAGGAVGAVTVDVEAPQLSPYIKFNWSSAYIPARGTKVYFVDDNTVTDTPGNVTAGRIINVSGGANGSPWMVTVDTRVAVAA
jgi:hypothetical protein